ncbi:MAG: MBL fold metallo-hydrolase, partial [Candidatus Binatia bacterium]
MAKDPLRTKFCEMMGVEFPVLAFTHCKDVVAAVVNAGGFAVLGEAMNTPDQIAADIKWIREKVGEKSFGIDLVLPDFRYLRERADQIEAFVLTHGHEDHVGALPWVLRELGAGY